MRCQAFCTRICNYGFGSGPGISWTILFGTLKTETELLRTQPFELACERYQLLGVRRIRNGQHSISIVSKVPATQIELQEEAVVCNRTLTVLYTCIYVYMYDPLM